MALVGEIHPRLAGYAGDLGSGDPASLASSELMNALQAAGATVELGDSVEQVFFSVTGRILKVTGGDVQVFDYESAQAMEADTAQ